MRIIFHIVLSVIATILAFIIAPQSSLVDNAIVGTFISMWFTFSAIGLWVFTIYDGWKRQTGNTMDLTDAVTLLFSQEATKVALLGLVLLTGIMGCAYFFFKSATGTADYVFGSLLVFGALPATSFLVMDRFLKALNATKKIRVLA